MEAIANIPVARSLNFARQILPYIQALDAHCE